MAVFEKIGIGRWKGLEMSTSMYRVLTVMCLTLGIFGCPQTVVNVPDECTEDDCPRVVPGADGGTGQDVPVETLSAFLSTERPILIRGDVEEGGAIVLVTSSLNATYSFEIDVAGFDNPEDFLDFCVGPADDCPNPDGILDEFFSFVRINRILTDPGATGTRVTVRVTVTGEGENPPSVTDTLVLDVVRRQTELALSITNPARVAPGGEVVITGLISGGSPFIYNGNENEANGCISGTLFQTPGLTKFRALPPLDEDGDPMTVLSPAQQVPFCVSASLTENGISADPGDVSFQPVEGDALFEVTSEGQTRFVLSYQSPRAEGVVNFDFIVTDEEGTQVSESAVIDIASADQLVISEATVARSVVAPGDSVGIDVIAAGGEPPYLIDISVDGDAIGRVTGSDCENHPPQEVCDTVRYVAPDNALGEDQIRVEVTDAIGRDISSLITVTVAAPQALAVDLEADSAGLQPNASTGIEASIIGGTPPYDVCFTVDAGTLFDIEADDADDDCESIVIGDTTYENCFCNLTSADPRGAALLAVAGKYRAPNVPTDVVNIDVAVRDSIIARNNEDAENVVSASVKMPISPNESGGTGGDGVPPVSVDVVATRSVVCSNQTTTLTAITSGGSGNFQFTWTIVETGTGMILNNNAPNSTFTAGGTEGTSVIQVTVQDQTSGGTAIASVAVQTVNGPAVNVGLSGPQEICRGEALALGGDPENPTATGGTAPFVYNWTVEPTNIGSFMPSASSANPTFIPNAEFDLTPPGNVASIRLFVTDALGCQSEGTLSVTILDQVAADDVVATNDAPDGTICPGTSVTLTGLPDDGALTFEWAGSDGFSADTRVATVTPPSEPDEYIYTLTIRNGDGCGSSAMTTVEVLEPPVSDIEAPASVWTGCEDVTLSVAGGAEPDTNYEWIVEGGLNVEGAFSPQVTFDVGDSTDPISVTLVATAFDPETETSGCSSTGMATISVNARPDATISIDSGVTAGTVCEGARINASVVEVAGVSYQWTVVSGGQVVLGSNASQVEFDVNQNAGTVSLMVEIIDEIGDANSNRCVSTGTIDLNVLDVESTCTDFDDECSTASCLDGVCQFPPRAFGTPCGDQSTSTCSDPDFCDGAGMCRNNHRADNTPCNDGMFCTVDDVCAGGACTGGVARDCDDGAACTVDTCNEDINMCESSLLEDSCEINGLCFAAGQRNPGNDCEECNPDLDASDWSFVGSGVSCGDQTSNACTMPDTCDGAGFCLNNHMPAFTECESDGNDCTRNQCFDGECLANPREAGSACGDPSNTDCTNPDTCDGLGSCQDNHESVGVACGDGSTTECTQADTCDGAGSCDPNDEPAGIACGDPTDDECTDPDTCDGSGVCDSNDSGNGESCDDGMICTVMDMCDDGICMGVFDGDPCDDGLTCTVDSCSSELNECVNDVQNGQCLIDGVCFMNGELNPENECEQCFAPETQTDWSPRTGAACGDSEIRPCSLPDTCNDEGVCDPNHLADGTCCNDDTQSCMDGVCDGTPNSFELDCSDGIDDDCDDLVDCDDPDCDGDAACGP